MALFKIFKGDRFKNNQDQLLSKSPVEGYVYFTEDEHKFYIDVETNTTAVIGEDGNRVPLNAYKADTLSQTLPISLGGTSATTAIEALSNLGGLTLLTRGISLTTTDNIDNLTANGAYYSASTNITTNLQGDKPFVSGFSLYQIQGYTTSAIKQFAQASNIIKYRYKPVSSTDDSWSNWETLSTLTASSATVGSTNIPVYLSAGTITAGSTYAGGTLVNLNGSNMGATAVNIYAATSSGTSGQFLISSGENSAPTWVSNITVPGTLNVIGQTTLNSNVTVDGWITMNELTITGQATAQTPTAAQHIATKGYVDNAIGQGFAANDAMVFKGIINSTSSFTTILSQDYSAGWTYRADGSFFLSSSNSNRIYYVEPGDLIIATQDKSSNGSINDWIVIEHNIDGGLYKSDITFIGSKILMSDGTGGKVKEGTITTATVVTSINFSAPTLGTNISADDITNWDAGSVPTLGTNISADDITNWDAGSSTTAKVEDGILKITIGTIPSLSYTSRSIPNITNVGTKPSLSYTSRSIPNITNVGNITLTTATVVASIS